MQEATRVLGDRYELGPLLGAGGMARVYLATDLTLARPVAVKLLAEPYDRDQGFVERFRREAHAAARLNHPNIVSVYDGGSDGETPFIVMELVEGETLADRLRREGPLPPDETARICADVARALGAAHEGGVVHRDVKPGNVMLADDGRVKVVDFGIARASGAEAVTRSGLVLGSASYLSPEQAQGGSVDARSDVYALGCVLYEMLTGRPPFVADDPVAALYQHVNEQPMAPSAFQPVPREMEAIALRALEKDPARRYASADEMESALRSALAEADDPAETTPLSPVENVTTAPIAVTPASTARVTHHRPRRRRFHGAASGRRWRVPALVVLGVVAAGLLVFLLFDRSDFPSRADLRAARIDARNEARADANAQNQQPEPTGPADPIPTVDEAYQGLIASITALAGDVESDVVEKLLDGANKILEEYQAGELAAVDDEIAHLREELVKMTSEAKIPAGSAETIGSALDQLVLAIAETPPPIVEGATGSGDEGSSHGGGEDHGNGPPPYSESGGHGGGEE